MKIKLIPAAMLLLCSGILLTACSKGGGGYNNSSTTTTTTTTGNRVSITNMSFSVASLTVKAGTTVTWTNNDNTTHTVTADDGSFGSADMKYGDTYSYTFSSTGTFAYHCKYHSSMTASVVVN